MELLILLVLLVFKIILIIAGIILLVRDAKENNDKYDRILMIISFLLPQIGLIIYAINVGKNKHITECTLKGLKMFLKIFLINVGMIIVSAVCVIVIINVKKEENIKNSNITEESIKIPDAKEESVEVPDVTNKSLSEAMTDIKNAELTVYSNTIEIADNNISKGKVVKTDPAAGRTVKKGTSVRIYLSTGTINNLN